MHAKSLPFALLAVALLAGCSAPVPAGTGSDLSYTPPVAGGATIKFQAFSGANPAGGIPEVGGQVQCSQPEPANPLIPPCKPAFSEVQVNATLPLAGDGKYSVYLVNATGELFVADLVEGALGHLNTATYTGGQNFTEDMTGRYTVIEIRYGGFLLAEAPAAAGAPMFALAAATRPTVQVDFVGHDLHGSVSGLQANATYQGNLYLPGPDGLAQATPAESFTITGDGPFTYTSTGHDISEFAEFHVHVGHSKINLYKAGIHLVE